MKKTICYMALAVVTLALLPSSLAQVYFTDNNPAWYNTYLSTGRVVYAPYNGYSNGYNGYSTSLAPMVTYSARTPIVSYSAYGTPVARVSYSAPVSLAGYSSSGYSSAGMTSYAGAGMTQYAGLNSQMQETVFQSATLPETHEEVYTDVLRQKNVVTLQNQVHNIWPITRVHHKTNYEARTISSTRVNPPQVVDIPEGSEAQTNTQGGAQMSQGQAAPNQQTIYAGRNTQSTRGGLNTQTSTQTSGRTY